MRTGALSDASIRRDCPEMFAYGFHNTSNLPFIPRRHRYDGIKGHHYTHRATPLTAISNIISAASFGGPTVESGILAHRSMATTAPTPPPTSPQFLRTRASTSRSPSQGRFGPRLRPSTSAGYIASLVRRFDDQYGDKVSDMVTVTDRAKAVMMAANMNVRDYVPFGGSDFEPSAPRTVRFDFVVNQHGSTLADDASARSFYRIAQKVQRNAPEEVEATSRRRRDDRSPSISRSEGTVQAPRTVPRPTREEEGGD